VAASKQPGRLFEYRVEHWGEVAGRAVDDLQHLGHRYRTRQAKPGWRGFWSFASGDAWQSCAAAYEHRLPRKPSGALPPCPSQSSAVGRQERPVVQPTVRPHGGDSNELFDGLPRQAARAFIDFVPHGYEGKDSRQAEPARVAVGS